MDQNNSLPISDHTVRVHQLYARHQQAVLAFVLTLEPRLDDAHEIVQETFLTVSQKAADWTDGTNVFAWVCTIARYTTMHFHRSKKRQLVELADDVVDLLDEERNAHLVDCEHRIAVLAECMQRLAPSARRLITQRYHAGRLPEEIASAIGWSVNSVRVALTRAKTALKDCLERKTRSEVVT